MATKIQATIEDLYRLPENRKAEIVNGELVLMAPTGFLPNRAASVIYMSLSSMNAKQNAAMPLLAMQASM